MIGTASSSLQFLVVVVAHSLLLALPRLLSDRRFRLARGSVGPGPSSDDEAPVSAETKCHLNQNLRFVVRFIAFTS